MCSYSPCRYHLAVLPLGKKLPSRRARMGTGGCEGIRDFLRGATALSRQRRLASEVCWLDWTYRVAPALSRLAGSRPVGCVGAVRTGAAGMGLVSAASAEISTLSPWWAITRGGPPSRV